MHGQQNIKKMFRDWICLLQVEGKWGTLCDRAFRQIRFLASDVECGVLVERVKEIIL